MPTFPAYAKILRDEFGEKRQNALLRSDFESGPARQARAKHRVMVTRPARIFISRRADYLAFLDWFRVDLNEGANWFDWFDPVRQQTVQARIVAGDLTASLAGGGVNFWTIPVQLETWG